MRPGSFNVICITFGDFTLLGHFRQLFEALTPERPRSQAAFNSPEPPKLYTKAAAKATLPGQSAVADKADGSLNFNPCAVPMVPSRLIRRYPNGWGLLFRAF